MIFVPDEAPTEVVEAMLARVPVTYGAVTLYAPVEPGASGSRGQHRITWEDPATRRRTHRGRTSLAAAWRLTVETAESLYRQQHGAEPPRPRITLAGLLRRYLDPRLHPHWSESRRKTVTTLLTVTSR